MSKINALLAASAIALVSASPALAAWDRTRAWDPAFDSSYDRQVEINASKLSPVTVTGGSAVATNDAAPVPVGPKAYFGPHITKFADQIKNDPYDN